MDPSGSGQLPRAPRLRDDQLTQAGHRNNAGGRRSRPRTPAGWFGLTLLAVLSALSWTYGIGWEAFEEVTTPLSSTLTGVGAGVLLLVAVIAALAWRPPTAVLVTAAPFCMVSFWPCVSSDALGGLVWLVLGGMVVGSATAVALLVHWVMSRRHRQLRL